MIINFIRKNKVYFAISLLVIISVIVLYTNKKDKVVASNENIVSEKTNKVKDDKKVEVKYLVVEIKGAVITPGVYTLKEGSRVVDLINSAGGLIEGANTDYINQSKKLEDQMVIKIYTNQEIEESNRVEVVTKYIEKECDCPKITNDACLNSDSNNNSNFNTDINTNISTSLVNINNCTLDQLLTLPGIGESKALAIIEYRKTNKFEKIEDIQNVTGIGASLYEKVKSYIEV